MSVERQLLMGAAGTATVVSDPYFKQTTLLLHADGTNGAQNNTFLDSSTNNFTITRNGNTTQGTFTPFSQAAGYWGNYFGGSSYLSIANNAAFQLNTGSYTIEGWIYPQTTSGSGIEGIINSMPSYATGTSTNWSVDFAGPSNAYPGLRFWTNLSSSPAYWQAISTNAWTHFAMVRSGTSYYCFINGSLVYSSTDSSNLATTSPVYIGSYASQYYFNGYISNIRVVKGSAVYTSAFTPSTTPLTAITNTSLLTCQSNRFVDNSANNFTLTPSGTPSIQPFSPFAPTAAYSTTVNGGSGYFDGTGDYLSAADNAALNPGSSAFSIEFWFYQTGGYANNTRLLNKYTNSTGGRSFEWLLASGVITVVLYDNGGTTNTGTSLSGGSVSLNTWNHVALCKSGGTASLFLNGQRVATIANSYTITSNQPLLIGLGNAIYFNGYMSNIRMLNGTSAYDPAQTTYTVPTAPLTAITNTQLLLSCTNAGIYDNAIKNDLETAGNAQISTSVKKYGTGSLYLDGTGDYLVAANSQGFNFGTGDFTVEMWVYVIANQANATLIDTTSGGGGTTGWFLEYSATRGMYFYIGNSTSISYATTPTLSTWTHLAVARSSGTCKLFINGTQVASSSLTTSASSTYPMYVGGVSPGGLVPFYGYIDDLRITKGVARYTATFTPPTSAFPNQ